jgi:hypothetical protein
VYGQHRQDGSYSLAVIDAGIGMAADALAASNRRLAGAESFTVAPSKYLGHYVAGRLAARHGIRVHVAPGHDGQGIVATVDLPSSLLVGHDPGPAPVGPSPARGSLAASATMSRPISGV